MDSMSIISAACAVWWIVSVASHLGVSIMCLIQPLLRQRSATRQDQPPVSVLVPVKEMEPELKAAFLSLFSQSYPDFEVLVSAAEKNSAALETARQIAAQFPHIKSRFIIADVKVAVSPKLNNLVTPLSAADHDLIFVKDSNIHLEAGQLSEFVRLMASDVGLVVAVPIATKPKTFAAEIECSIMNGYGAPALLAASAIGWGIGQGKAMLFDRHDLERVGGIESISDTITEDHALSKVLGRLDLKTITAGTVVRQVLGERRFSEVWNRHLRWMFSRYSEEPLGYYVEMFLGTAFTALVGYIGAPFFDLSGWAVAAGTILLRLLVEMCVLAIKGWPISWKSPLAAFCCVCIIPVLWVQARLIRKVFWGKLAVDVRQPAP
jgi:ceramide glucosyltransferase